MLRPAAGKATSFFFFFFLPCLILLFLAVFSLKMVRIRVSSSNAENQAYTKCRNPIVTALPAFEYIM